jgi:hypothetical protein
MTGRNPRTVDEQGTTAGVLVRLWWMLFGNFIFALCIVFIVQNRGEFFHAADPVFGITVASLALARYIDIRFCKGLTATGAPASMKTWVRYAAFLVLGSTVAWALAHGASYLLSGRA